MAGQFGIIRGDAGVVTAAGGAQVGIISRWVVMPSGNKPDGTPMLRFKAQFSWVNDILMNLRMNGMPVKKRIVLKMRTKAGLDNVEIIGWDDWKFEGGILVLENIVHAVGVQSRQIAVTR